MIFAGEVETISTKRSSEIRPAATPSEYRIGSRSSAAGMPLGMSRKSSRPSSFCSKVKAQWSGPDYAELRTGSAVLAIFSFDAQQRYIPDVTEAARNRSMILEFRVVDADREYSRLQGLVRQWVKPPTTQPWGTRSISFRDPDGHLVDFFVPAKAR